MKIHIITPFPDMVNSIIECSILGKAHERGCVEYQVYNLFDFLENSTNKRIDDYPFGGGAGMILKPEPIFEAFNLDIVLVLSKDKLTWSLETTAIFDTFFNLLMTGNKANIVDSLDRNIMSYFCYLMFL